jgi:lysophospholipase L1-like esterase
MQLAGSLQLSLGAGGPAAPIALANGPWSATRAKLKGFLAAHDGAANPHALAQMSAPPTIRAVSSLVAPDTDLTVAYRYSAATGVLRYEGGGNKSFAAGTYRQFPAATQAASGGNLGSGENSVLWQVRLIANAAKLAFRLLGSARAYRFIVDGRYVSAAGTFTAVNTGTQYIVLDFGSKAVRSITIENQESTAFDGVYVAPGDAVTLPSASPFRLLALGDSFAAGAGAGHVGDGLFAVAGDYLATSDRWLSGVGGTGYVATSGGTAYTLSQRLSADLGRFRGLGAADMVVVAAGLNDVGQSGIAAAAAALFTAIRAAAPEAVVFVVGPWDTAAPVAVGTSYTAAKAAIRTAMAGREGFWFLDPEGRAFTKSDGTHPDTAGHLALGQWLATSIRAILVG